MEISKLKKFAQYARRSLNEQVQVKLKLVLTENSAARRENPEAMRKLEEQIKLTSEEQVVEKAAYTWFNRFCALRFMDVNRYTRIGIVSPAEGQFQPEILAEAKMGHIHAEIVPEATQKKVFDLLYGKAPSPDPQAEAYRLLVVTACNFYNKVMPYLFEKIADYTELLMPDDLLSGNSILAYTREAMPPDACIDKEDPNDPKPNVELIGWLYQFYISEKKDEVFEWLKKNKKITPENIPAATQLFTPRWIVRYLVENSLGRLWMLNRPNSRLIDKMPYYIKPEQVETDFIRVNFPEEIKVCDPACGSGHMLVYAFDLLHAIYEEEGYDPLEIPEKILKHNLYGIEIDERAAELAALALTMKARARYKRFFEKPVQPNICAIQPVKFTIEELDQYMAFVGRDLFTSSLEETLHQFEEADNFGSLIQPKVTQVSDILALLKEKNAGSQLFLHTIHPKVIQALTQADYLSPKYHVVIANPPYMGGKGMNPNLGDFVKKQFPNSKSDLFAVFIERNLKLAQQSGMVAMITMQSWMFLSSFEKLRASLMDGQSLLSMAHLGARAFDSIGGEVVSTTAFIFKNAYHPAYKGGFVRLVDGGNEAEKDKALKEASVNPNCGWFYRASAADFKKIPGKLIAYWVTEKFRNNFEEMSRLGEVFVTREGLTTGSNDIFIRLWFEVSLSSTVFPKDDYRDGKWFAYLKGGEYRRWAGNNEYLVDWEDSGKRVVNFIDLKTKRVRSHNYNGEWTNKPGITWSSVSGESFSVRNVAGGYMFDTTGSMGFVTPDSDRLGVIAFLNSTVATAYMKVLSPAIRFQPGHSLNLPFDEQSIHQAENIANRCITLSQSDWDSSETSWDFCNLSLLLSDYHQPTIEAAYQKLRSHWWKRTIEMKRLEEENSRIFIETYGLKEELSPEVPLNEITLTCNPHYRYGGDKTEEELEALLLADTMKEFISYAVGCMFGRYALEKPGLILANQGETLEDYLKQVPESNFPADEDNVIPILDGDWFTDDITERLYKFLKVTFGEEHYEENLRFIENAIGKDVRKYFQKDFYTDHVKRYKKRPIYWLFSSPKGNFNALIYMHRYRPDTVSVVLNDYLREFRTKLSSHFEQLQHVEGSASASQTEKTKALKEIENLKKMIAEMNDYEQEVLYPLASKRIEINLDDGVKVNYLKFGGALKKIPGLEAKED
ncbi:BREX-1 system adenine-specific DNA-methyltransferase PglX [Vampirovibrio sp.]|uniref:BREX-1 system adenine-specific DNA-methyltransferase PglX n=1 Tax=Vampirovibrio sp. TaxID=2717857 RepID=UPI0035930942